MGAITSTVAVALAAGCSSTPLAEPGPTKAPPATVQAAAVPASPTDERACELFGRHLPHRLERLAADRVSAPTARARRLVHAWGSPAIVVQCGIAMTQEQARQAGSTSVAVDHIRWYQQVRDDAVVWTTVREGTALVVTVPKSYPEQGAVLVDLAKPIRLAFG